MPNIGQKINSRSVAWTYLRLWRECKWQTSGQKKTSGMAYLSGRFCFHILKNMEQIYKQESFWGCNLSLFSTLLASQRNNAYRKDLLKATKKSWKWNNQFLNLQKEMIFVQVNRIETAQIWELRQHDCRSGRGIFYDNNSLVIQTSNQQSLQVNQKLVSSVKNHLHVNIPNFIPRINF